MSFFKKLKKFALPALALAGSIAAPALAPSLISGIGSLGSVLGNVGGIASGIGAISGLLQPKQKKEPPIQAAQATPFTPIKPTAIARPSALAGFSGFDPQQERAALATKGLNQGLGKQEEDYYTNLIQRSLIGDTNQVTSDSSALSPIESQYFSQKGFNTSDIMKFLQQLQGGI